MWRCKDYCSLVLLKTNKTSRQKFKEPKVAHFHLPRAAVYPASSGWDSVWAGRASSQPQFSNSKESHDQHPISETSSPHYKGWSAVSTFSLGDQEMHLINLLPASQQPCKGDTTVRPSWPMRELNLKELPWFAEGHATSRRQNLEDRVPQTSGRSMVSPTVRGRHGDWQSRISKKEKSWLLQKYQVSTWQSFSVTHE